MDNIFEILIPLAIAAVYFFGNMFSGKSKEDDAAPPSLPRQRGADEENDDADAFERQRRIQEEIRRKIMERRRDSGSAAPQAAPVGQDLHERRSDVKAPRETRETQKKTREVVHESRDGRAPNREARRDSGYETTSPAFSWDQSDNAYDSGIEAQLQRIEATKRQAEKLQKQAAARRKTTKEEEQPKRRTGGYFTGTVRQSLQDPQAARVALIYGEVLGPPVALRKGAGSVPGLN
jgi:hypothetical protein